MIRPSQAKFVVDNMLHGLGKELRVAGCDAVILGDDDPHTDAIRVSPSMMTSSGRNPTVALNSMLGQKTELFYRVVHPTIS
jgi:hypothetical protein